ncbi:hypothetical protein LJC26_01390, partial [Desulfovibrio sp. OttesenSCG-928-O18]|nr:hypothetical protein [Desulfovibrio sp. OttesenSCG-928-O18]
MFFTNTQTRKFGASGYSGALLLGLIVVLSILYGSIQMKPKEIYADARQYVYAALSLHQTGTLSFEGKEPGYYREPLPSLFLSWHFKLFTDITKETTFDEIVKSERLTSQITKINLLYLAVILLLISFLAKLITHSTPVIIFSVILTSAYCVNWAEFLNAALSESVSTMFLVANTVAFVLLYQKRSIPAAILTGLSLGLLSLSKAIAFHVGIVGIPVAIAALYCWRLASPRRALVLFLWVSLSFSATVVPWMVRNAVYCDNFTIADRGAHVLWTRVTKDKMTDEEYKGSFYVYSYGPLRKVVGALTGYSPGDMQRGG